MKGSVKVYEYIEGVPVNVFEDKNMILEGAKESIVDLLTYNVPPSSVSSTPLLSVSSFTIGALTLGSPSVNFKKHDSRYALSLDHASGINYLGVSGELSGIHALSKNLDNRLLNKTGSPSYLSTSQPRKGITSLSLDGSSFSIEKFGSPTIEIIGGSIKITKNVGQEYCNLSIDTPLKYGKSYFLELKGSSTSPFTVSYISKDSSLGGKRYLNFETGKFSLGKKGTNIEFNKQGVASLVIEPDYTELENTSIQSIEITCPNINLYELGEFTLSSINVFDKDRDILKNQEFSSIRNWIFNSDFETFNYVSSVNPEISIAEGIIDLPRWKVESNFSSTVDPSTVGYVRKGDDGEGITFQASSLEGSGSASISQIFIPPSLFNNIHYSVGDRYPFNPFAVLNIEVLSETPNPNGINVHLKDLTTGEYFEFQDNSFDSGGSWGSDTPWVIGDRSRGSWRTYSTNIPLRGRVGNRFELTLRANGTSTGMASYKVKDVILGNIVGWEFGNKNVRLADIEEGGGIYLSGTQENIESQPYSGLTYVGQKFVGVEPIKNYSLVLETEPLGSSGSVGVTITHRGFSNYSDTEQYDVSREIGILNTSVAYGVSKNVREGYQTYLNPKSSPSAVASFSNIDENNLLFRNDKRSVEFDASFQDNSERLFVPLSPGTHTLDLDYSKVSNTENYSVALVVRNTDSTKKDYFYNFFTKKWVTFLAQDTPELEFNNLTTDLSNLNDFTFSLIDSELPNSKGQGKYNVYFIFVSEIEGVKTNKFQTPIYIHDIFISDSESLLSNNEFYNGVTTTPVKYYTANGAWKNDTTVSKDKLAVDTLPSGTVLEFSAVAGEKITIPINGHDEVSSTDRSVFDVMIFPLSGEGVFVKEVTLSDYSLIGYGGGADISDINLVTSESDITRIPFIEGGWHIHSTSAGIVNDGSVPNVGITTLNGVPTFKYVKDTSDPQAALLTHTARLEDIDLTSSSFKVSFDYVQDASLDSAIKFGVLWKRGDTGVEYIWDFEDRRWKLYYNGLTVTDTLTGISSIPDFPYSSSNNDSFNNYISDIITLPNQKKGDFLSTYVFIDQTGPDAEAYITNLRYYSLVTPIEASSVFPEFPNPEDTTVQPIVPDGPGRLGHFLNQMEFRGRGVDTENYEEAVYDGCYSEGSGTTVFSAGSYVSSYGNLNQYGVITPNGFILEQKKVERASQDILDSSAGLVVSAITPVSSTRQVSYAITLTRDEWFLLYEKYGGLGGIGLWAYDYVNTSKKLGSDEGLGGPPFISSGSPTSLATSAGAGVTPSRNDVTTNPSYLNGYTLRMKAGNGANLSFAHTGFGAPPGRVNVGGWCHLGDDYILQIDYKAVGSNVKVQSDNFSPVTLSGDNVWRREIINFTAPKEGHNKVGFVLRKESDVPEPVSPELLIGSALLYNSTSSTVVESYDFSSPSDVSAFSTKWNLPNFVEPLSITWDGDFYTTSLYNSSELASKEPVYRLFSKKVFFPGGLQINPSSDYITIIWTIDF